ncbi:hypothetical protein DXG01_014996 [Tephrocybe rancida]|nr:hypothetical protein DXG01_014996 [Tephrocybe rancida]
MTACDFADIYYSILAAMADEDKVTLSSTVRHPVYYFEDGVVIFLVENTLFKVHRYYLTRESEVFRGMFELPPGSDEPEGTDDDHPIRLPEVTTSEFESLMHFFYQGMRRELSGVLGPCSQPHLSQDEAKKLPVHIKEWTDLLSIADRYMLLGVRNEAIERINSNPGWKIPAYESLCRRQKPISFDEAKVMGLENFVSLANARELLRQHPPKSGNSWPGSATDTVPEELPYEPGLVTSVVQSAFNLRPPLRPRPPMV